jgi:hypothetical protein
LKRFKIYELDFSDYELIEKNLKLEEIIFRDRYLRSIPVKNAKELIYTTSKFFINFFKNKKFDLIITYPVDNYITDIMIKIAEIYSIEARGLVTTFLEDYIRISTHGENNFIRQPSDKEINNIHDRLVSNFKSHMVPASYFDSIKNALISYGRYKVRYLWFYLFKYKIQGKINYDYVTTPLVPHVKKLHWFYPERFYIKNININRNSKNIYIPLHFFPETTIEYWVDNFIDSDYIFSLLKTIKYFSEKNYSIYLKEHPAMYCRRDVSFYKIILEIKNVFILNPFLETRELLKVFEGVVVWTGSTGIESLVNGKKVHVMTTNYWSKEKNSLAKNDFFQLKTDNEKKVFISYFLSNMIKLRLK